MDPKSNATVLHSEQYDRIRASVVFQNFKYIKTFTPIRRPTTSYAATVRFMIPQIEKEGRIVSDDLTARMLNRSFMVDPWDRLYRDSVLVRFEDGKLNPRATFTALAKFFGPSLHGKHDLLLRRQRHQPGIPGRKCPGL